ncbi:MAG: class I SAM-dependent methyltransferase [Pseudomonadota bacterium]
MRDTDSDWDEVARTFPYWGVLSVDQFKKKNLSQQDRESFFASGENYFKGMMNVVRRHLGADLKIKRGLDFGCGVGRLAIPMARIANDEVVGVDISDEMLKICADNASAMGVANLVLVKGDDNLSKVTGTFDFINSYIVLQHIPPARGYQIIQRLLDLLEAGGVGSLQLTYAKSAKFFEHERAKAGYYRRDGSTLIELKTKSDERATGAITMFDYDLNCVFALIQEISDPYLSVRVTDHDGHLGIHVVFRKK